MSAVALGLVVGFLSLYGVVHQEDEGTAARIFQLLIAAQVPIVAFFLVKWVPQDPRKGLILLALQLGAAMTAILPVFLLEL